MEKEKDVAGGLPWDQPKPDPDDLDLFESALEDYPRGVVFVPISIETVRTVDRALARDLAEERLNRARIAARPILEAPPVKE